MSKTRPPTLQEVLKSALHEGEQRTKLAEDASASAATKSEEEEKKRKEAEEKKKAQAQSGEGKAPPTDMVEKAASALEFVLANAGDVDWDKVAMEAPPDGQTAGPGVGNTALEIAEATTPGKAPGNNQGQSKSGQPPMSPGIDPSALVSPGTTITTDMNKAPGDGKTMGKLQELGGKTASLEAHVGNVLSKMAADSGAQISAGPKPPSAATAAGEGKLPMPPTAAKGESLIATNQAAIDATKRQAKQVDTKPTDGLLSEPTQKKSGDTTLHQALDHTDEAGAKISALKISLFREWLTKQASIVEDPNASQEQRTFAQMALEAAAKTTQGGAA